MAGASERLRLVYVVTHPVSADLLLRGQLGYMRDAGFDVTIVASPGRELDRVATREGVRAAAVPMRREPAPREDAASLAKLTVVLRKLRPDIVHASTPKAGLLGMLAARALSVKTRVYLLRGLRLETARGKLRRVLGATERITSACAHEVACVSGSLLDVAVRGGWVPRAKACVVGHGSSNGVDFERFLRTPAREEDGERLFASHGITRGERVVAFVGRLVRDKGIEDALNAFEAARARVPGLRLALVGGGLGDDDLDPVLRDRVRRTAGVVEMGKLDDLAPVYLRSELLLFPSHREGFPNVPLEAACAGLPTVGFRATGTVDCVRDGETGELVAVGDAQALGAALVRHLEDRELTKRRGQAALVRAKRDFDRNAVWAAWRDELYRLARR